MKTVFDSSFKYYRSVETDVGKTFARIRREQQAERRRKESAANSGERVKVMSIDPTKEGKLIVSRSTEARTPSPGPSLD
jgi:hypothetical protein